MSDAERIHFFKEGIAFRLNNAKNLKRWIAKLFREHKIAIENINYIFCSDNYLRKINKQYLNHDYYTDIITFDNSAKKGKTEADIYISIDRVKINAKEYKSTFRDELHRVMIHGALHLAGYKDKSGKDTKKMRDAEELWLSKRF